MQCELRGNGIAVVTLDCEGEQQNTLSPEMFDEFEEVFATADDSSCKAVVLLSGKKDSWVAGANIKAIQSLTSAEGAMNMAHLGQQAMDRVAGHPKPWVAAIDGACLGGGLELALACDHRIASSSSKTVLGVPEVMLGLLPGAGGTQRLPKLVGAASSLDLMLTGKQIKAARAKKMGLVDSVVDPNALERAAIASAELLASGELRPKSRKLSWMDWFLERTPIGRSVLFSQAAKKG
jgi:enoyl-CoA hydratase/carnithine racemase